MSETRRATRLCTFDELRPELAAAIRIHAQRQQWTNWESDILACCETTSERIDRNPLDAWLNGNAPRIKYLAVLALPQRLVWASSDGAICPGAASALYQEMRLKIFTPKLASDIVLEIYARMDGTREKVGGKLKLDAGQGAREFCAEIQRATSLLIEPQPEKPRRKWFGK